MAALAGRSWQNAASSSSRIACFSTSAQASARTIIRPPATRPASQKDTKVPANVYELTKAYPRHPLLAFFNTDPRKIKDTADAKQTGEVEIPAALRASDLIEDQNSRSWLAPELRTKSSLDLHQLWYSCLMERNKIRTTLAEVQRVGARQLLQANRYNGYSIDRRVRKTMARIKFVLNERRLALLEARRNAAELRALRNSPLDDENFVSETLTEEQSELYEDVKKA